MNNDLNNKKTKKRDMKNKPLLSATVDIVFKKLFIENPDLLSSLLESFLPLKSSIQNIEIKNPNMTGNLQSQAQKSNSESQSQKSSHESNAPEPQSQKSSPESSNSEPQSRKSSPESNAPEPQSQKSSPESSNSEPQSRKSSPESNAPEPQSQKSSHESSTSESQEQKKPASQSSSQASSKVEFVVEDSTIHPEKPDLKTMVMDLKVKLSSGESINIEVQTSNQHGFTKRILFYLSKLFTEDLKKGADFDDLKPAYSLIFTTFPLFDEFKEHLSTFSMIRETHPHVIFSESMRIILVELPKFQKSMDKPFDLSDFWCYFLLKVGENLTKEEKAFLLKNKDTKMALEHLAKMSQNEVLRERALEREKNWLAYHLDKKGTLKQGREEGLKEGREEGLKEGIQKGKEEIQQATVLTMIELNYSAFDISKVTKWSEDDIKKLMK